MNNIYAISDIHGEYDLFLKMLEEINFSEVDKLIILGDVLDRGKQPLEILEYIIEKDNIEMIMGNHEKMFLDFVLAKNESDKYFAYHVWMNNGGYTTLMEYDKLNTETQNKIINYIKALPLYKTIDSYILVHSGLNMSGLKLNLDINGIIEAQEEDDFLWSREDFYNFKAVDDYTIIFGHTPTPFLRNQTENYNFRIWHDENYKDKIGIDSGATFEEIGGMLSCLRLNDMEEFYIR
jgi:serine/threonine protein phosphatase 1